MLKIGVRGRTFESLPRPLTSATYIRSRTRPEVASDTQREASYSRGGHDGFSDSGTITLTVGLAPSGDLTRRMHIFVGSDNHPH